MKSVRNVKKTTAERYEVSSLPNLQYSRTELSGKLQRKLHRVTQPLLIMALIGQSSKMYKIGSVQPFELHVTVILRVHYMQPMW